MARFFECFRCRQEISTTAYYTDDFDPQRFFCGTKCLGWSRQWDAEFTPQPLDDSVGGGVQDGDHSQKVLQFEERGQSLQMSDANVWVETGDGNRQMS